MNSTQGLGPVAAVGIAVALARHADAAAGAAGDLRPMVLLAGASDVRLRRPHRDRPLGPGRPAHRPRPAPHLGGHRAACSRSPRSACFQLDADGLQNKDAFYGTPDSVVGEDGARPALPGGLRPAGDRDRDKDEAGAVRTALAGDRRHRRRRRPGRQGRPGASCRARSTDAAGQPGGQGHRRPGPRRGARGRRARTPRSAAAPRSSLDTLRASSSDNTADHPDRAAGGVPDPDAAAARGGRAAGADRRPSCCRSPRRSA